MDLSQLSDADLMALKSGGLSKVSDEGLMLLKGNAPTPVAQNQGTPIYGDVPTVAGQKPNITRYEQAPQAKPVTMMDRLKTLYEVPTAIASSAVTEPASMLYGIGRSGLEGAMKGQAPSGQARDEYYRQAKRNISYQPTSPESETILGTIGEGITAAKLPPYIPAIGQIPSAARMAKPAGNQMANALRNEAGMVQEAVTPTIQRGVEAARPVMAKAAEITQPVTNKLASALRKEPSIMETAPTSAQLAEESTRYFNKAKASGVELNPEYFGNMMKSIGTDLRELGYDSRTMPKVAVALENLQNKEIPKDFQELSVLRKFIRNAQRSKEPDEKMVATRLKSEFDDYIANMPESSIIGGSKEGLADWKKARDTYTKLSKSEVFEDMLDKAEIRDSKLSTEQYLHNKLLQLAEDDRRLRLFTPEEQEAIKQAAKGTGMQNFMANAAKLNLKNLGVTTLGSLLGLSLAGPVGAVAAPAIGGLAKYKATKMRKSDVENLAAMVRAGKKGAENE